MLVNKDRFVEMVTHYAIDRVNNDVQRENHFKKEEGLICFQILKKVIKKNYQKVLKKI